MTLIKKFILAGYCEAVYVHVFDHQFSCMMLWLMMIPLLAFRNQKEITLGDSSPDMVSWDFNFI